MNCMETNKTVRIGMIALGCNKNQVDAELMLGALEKEGFEIVENAADCDVVIVKEVVIDTIDRKVIRPEGGSNY